MKNVILECKNIKKEFKKKDHVHKAADDISFELYCGECLGIVGESGSGKSTLAKMIMKLEKPDSGEIIVDGEDILKFKGRKVRDYYGVIQMVFQDAKGSFNPKMTIGSSIMEYICNLCYVDKNERRKKVVKLLEEVGLNESHYDRYPHELSGGQCQRAAIARALSVHPKIIIFDEATSGLDVSVQAQVVELLKKTLDERDISYIFISHDLKLVSSFCGRIGVMYYGRLIECGKSYDVINNPKQDYTKLLIESVL
ncbi:ABC transporter ATP-binding protein [uncultured Clostridium sp.]|uniref:ABC transporter ATP-binding protein n=1 Tax=uncultured Clostridium sp. TaxID=59620 RepID=UPI0025D84DB3|nr:ATP-binding cassette domain-containing protein [uncultured Clostridium sp.]